jgi:8-oxo-dGTP diphosphatase
MAKIIGNISVDCVIFGFHNGTLSVLLTRRELNDPATGDIIFSDYTVQGHHVLEGENVDDAAARVLKDKTGLSNIYLKQFYTFGDTDRLLHKNDQIWRKNKYPVVSDHVISVGYYALVDSSKVNPDQDHQYTSWFPVNGLPVLGYDHDIIIMRALDYLRNEIRREPVGFELLPDKFSLTQLQQLFEAILGVKLDKRNFRKKVAQMRYVIALNEKQNSVSHKPAQVYMFSREVHEKTRREKPDFYI